MKILKNDQSGFGAVELIMAVVILALIAIVGFTLYNNQHKSKMTPAIISTTTTKPTVTTPAPTTTSAPANPKETPKNTTLQIKELGIAIVLPDDVKDLVYVASKPGSVTLSSKSLLEIDAGCTATTGSLGAFVKVDGQYNANTATGKLMKQFKNYHLVHTPMMGCPKGYEDKVGTLFAKQSSALQSQSVYDSVTEL